MPDQYTENLKARCDPLLDNIGLVKGQMHQMAVLLMSTSARLAQGIESGLLSREDSVLILKHMTANACTALAEASCLERKLPISDIRRIAEEITADCLALSQQIRRAKDANSG